MIARLQWRYRRWRARHYELFAGLAYDRHPTPRNADTWERATDHLRKVEAGRP